MAEYEGYRDVLESLLNAFGGRHWLRVSEAAAFLGMDNRTVKKRFLVGTDGIATELFARRICHESKNH